MLENIQPSSIPINELGWFQNSKVQGNKAEYVLAHIVRMSQKEGKWLEEITLADYFAEFDSRPAQIRSGAEFMGYLMKLNEEGYLKVSMETPSFRVTERFAELCEEYAEKQ